MHLDEIGGLVELVLIFGEAFGLELFEQGDGLFELAGEALAVKACIRSRVVPDLKELWEMLSN
jgi:hypothetical protein